MPLRRAHTRTREPRTLASSLTTPCPRASHAPCLAEIGTLNVGANLNTYCQVTTCIYQNMDYGGWASPCGYAPMLRITMNGAVVTSAGVQTSLLPLQLTLTPRANGLSFSGVLNHSYYAAPFTLPGIVADGGSAYSYRVDNTLDSAAKCQALCRNLFGCAYFSYEFEYQPAMRGWVHECFQKSEYVASQVPAGFTLESCHHYTMWESGPEWDMHFEDQYWVGAGGPANCGTFRADSVQSVAVVNVPGFTNAIVVAASPSEYHFAPGALTFYDAATLTYMGCAATGVKPEGIASFGSLVACIDEGSMAIELCGPGQIAQGRCTSAFLNKPLLSFNRHMALDQRGSMTMCQLTPASGSVAIGCTVYQVNSTNFVAKTTGSYPGFLTAQEYRILDVRLYGPSGDSVSFDVEPEGGAFTADGRYFIVNLQDNNAYIVFDVALRKYVRMEGYGYKEMTMDASDRDNGIFIRSGWGTNSATKSYGMYQPDVISSWTQDGLYYFITANEGDTRAGEDLIGVFGSFEGEEIRTGSITGTTCTNGCKADGQLGRLLTTTFMPSDYAANACGTQICEAWQLAAGNSATSFECVYYGADYGGRNDVYNVRGHPECGYATTVEMSVNCLNCAGQFALTPATPKRASVGTANSTSVTAGGAAPWGSARNITVGCSTFAPCAAAIPIPANFAFPSWYTSTNGVTVVDPTLNGPVACRLRCAAHALCDHWSYEFEDGYHECVLKRTCATANCVDGAAPVPHCDTYIRWAQHWGNQGGAMNRFWEGFAGPKACPAATALYTTELYTAAQTTHVGHGVSGGHTSSGARSFTIWSWNGSPSSSFVRVFDSGDEFEQKQVNFPGNLCSLCINSSANSTSCLARCPFNSGVAPPAMDDRSDAKGPEPECVTTGIMSDTGKRLAFVGVERTGGIYVYDVSTPAQSRFQDYLNVRNWRSGEVNLATGALATTGSVAGTEVTFNLNDGPESLVFVSAADSPLGREMLLAATPLAGRLTAYIIEQGPPRGNDGSCPNTAACPYLSTTVGGTGLYRNPAGKSTINPCSICRGAACTRVGCAAPPPPSTFPPAPPGVAVSIVRTVEISMRAQGTAATTNTNAIKATTATRLGVPASDVTVTVADVPASAGRLRALQVSQVDITIFVSVSTAAAATAVESTANSVFTSAAAASSIFGITVTTSPTVAARTVLAPTAQTPTTSSDPNKLPDYGIGIIIAVSILAAAVCCIVVYMYRQEKAGRPIFTTISKISTVKNNPDSK